MKLALVLALAACGNNPVARPVTFGGDRPVDIQIPTGFDDSMDYPLILILHGYGANGFVQEAVFGLKAEVTNGRAFVLAPTGNVDSTGKPFWNADPACCDFDHTNVDDSTYLHDLVTAVTAAYPVSRVLVVGHSNGGYMAYRMACDHADVVENIVVLAGAAASDPAACMPSRDVEVLHLHGDQDVTVPYAEAAMPSVDQWAQHDHCAGTFHAGPTLDIDADTVGAETSTQLADGCPSNIDIELWTIAGAGHIPNFNAMFEPAMYQWFLDHVRP
jgi:polyhydroxybutyrate depolymerase